MAVDSIGELPKETGIKDRETTNKDSRAIRKGKEIWIPPCNAINLFGSLTHELGHILSDELSFRQGGILTPDIAGKETLDISINEIERAYHHLFGHGQNAETANTDLVYKLVREAVAKLTGKKIDVQKLNLTIHYNVPPSEIDEIIRKEGGSSTSVVNADGTETPLNTKSGRNDEVPAIAVEEACLRLLENTIKKHYPGFWISSTCYNEAYPSHFRAARILRRAYCSRGWVLPSLKDLNTTPSNKPQEI